MSMYEEYHCSVTDGADILVVTTEQTDRVLVEVNEESVVLTKSDAMRLLAQLNAWSAVTKEKED